MNRRLREETFWQIKGRLSAGTEIVKVAELFGLNKTTIRNVARSLNFEEFRLFSTGKYKNSDIEEYRRKKLGGRFIMRDKSGRSRKVRKGRTTVT